MRFTSWMMLTDPSWPSASFASICWRRPTRLLNMAMSSSVMVIWPRPPISISISSMICPCRVKAVPVSTTPRPVTLMAEVAVNRALMKVTSPLWLEGCTRNRVPIRRMMRKLPRISLASLQRDSLSRCRAKA
ncbi:hypothetical protein D3C86_1847620 [compost metagenome]